MTLVAPRIVSSVSCVTRINHKIHFAWQAQYLVMLEDATCCSAHCKYSTRRIHCCADTEPVCLCGLRRLSEIVFRTVLSRVVVCLCGLR